MTAQYTVAQLNVSQIIASVQKGEIAIPELQRPFVWKSSKVRDLLDSLYKGYPVGYLITWQSVGAKLRHGEVAAHQQILIDGQQRVTALRAAVAGLPVINNRYKQVRIKIAFNPVTEEFETLTPVIERDSQWISDISEYFNSASPFSFINDYLAANPEVDKTAVPRAIERLGHIKNAQIGTIALNSDLEVETVTEIFIRINSKGVPLSSADFVMSKVASYGEQGRNIRKLIDYFCHLAIAPHAYDDIAENDKEFARTEFFQKIAWLKDDSEDLYDPEYGDVIRVAGIVGFNRGLASALVSRLSGRDPDTREVDESLIPIAYQNMEKALLQIVKKFHLQNFIMTVKSAGFIAAGMINSKNVLNFAYALYLKLQMEGSYPDGEIKRIVRRWLVMSLLTGRHSGSFETTWEADLRYIQQKGATDYLAQLEEGDLSDSFWEVTLPQALETTATNSPYFQTFLAAQVVQKARGFLSDKLTVASMIEQSGDIHHLFPKEFLKTHGFNDRRDYNQVANYAKTDTAINLRIGKREPRDYMEEVAAQIAGGPMTLGDIHDSQALRRNLTENAIPSNFASLEIKDYPDFLALRRKLMAKTIREYYHQL